MSDQSALEKINQNITLILKRMTALEEGQQDLRTGQEGLLTRLGAVETGEKSFSSRLN